jgi:GT2 family glycosyltransferase
VTAPDVSVIVIGHNVLGELRACFASLQRHAGDLALETILVDNGSTDATADSIAREFPDVRLVRLASNEGVPARNHGLRRCRGRYRMFLDSDAQLTEGALPTMVDRLERMPRVGLVGPRLVYPSGELQLSVRRYPPLAMPLLRLPGLRGFFEHRSAIRRHLMAGEPHHRRMAEYVLGACQIFRAEAQADAGEIDAGIWFGPDDADWCFSMRCAGWDVLYEPDATVIHSYRQASAARPLSRHTARHFGAFFHFHRKWWPARRRLLADGRAMDDRAALAPLEVPR